LKAPYQIAASPCLRRARSLATRFLLFFCSAWIATLLPLALPVQADENTSAFGSSVRTPGTLIGIFYDLKQDQNRQPRPKAGGLYTRTLDQFISSRLDEGVLAGFFRATRPLYATRIWMPEMDANIAPKAFGVGDVVAPSLWIAHYKGQITPPASGTYRFLGDSDDSLVVVLSEKVVLIANHPATPLPLTAWHSKEKSPAVPGTNPLVAGDWFTVRKDEILDLDVIVGERPGGRFRAILCIEKNGALPGPFRLTDEPTPGRKERSDEAPPWRALP